MFRIALRGARSAVAVGLSLRLAAALTVVAVIGSAAFADEPPAPIATPCRPLHSSLEDPYKPEPISVPPAVGVSSSLPDKEAMRHGDQEGTLRNYAVIDAGALVPVVLGPATPVETITVPKKPSPEKPAT